MNRIQVAISTGLVAILLAGCGADITFKRARSAEKKGKTYRAWTLYQNVAARYPTSSHAPEALFRAGWLAQNHLHDCGAAQTFYEDVITRFPNAKPWADRARLQLNDCPDFFPLVPGSQWVEGDSESGGKNARIEVTCEAVKGEMPAQAGRLVRNYFAGDSKFKTTRFFYRKTGDELLEYEDVEAAEGRPVLKWPLKTGTRWMGKLGGRLARYEIVATDKTVKVAAGEFSNCAHVSATIEGTVGATNEYYAPGVGRVLTSFTTRDDERRNTELLSYDIKSLDDEPKEGAP